MTATDTIIEAPKAGDVLNIFGHDIVLTEDMRQGIDRVWNELENRYEELPRMTREDAPRPVYYADGYSWRPGEAFAKSA